MPANLPVIVGFGGINPAGRLSFHHAYRRKVIDAIGAEESASTFASLGALMGVEGDKLDIEFDKAGAKKVVAKFVVSADQADDVPF